MVAYGLNHHSDGFLLLAIGKQASWRVESKKKVYTVSFDRYFLQINANHRFLLQHIHVKHQFDCQKGNIKLKLALFFSQMFAVCDNETSTLTATFQPHAGEHSYADYLICSLGRGVTWLIGDLGLVGLKDKKHNRSILQYVPHSHSWTWGPRYLRAWGNKLCRTATISGSSSGGGEGAGL